MMITYPTSQCFILPFQHHPGPDAVVYPCTVFGDWGCRTRDRDTQLRAVLQWVGASRAGLPGIQYCTGDGPQGKQVRLGEVS